MNSAVFSDFAALRKISFVARRSDVLTADFFFIFSRETNFYSVVAPCKLCPSRNCCEP